MPIAFLLRYQEFCMTDETLDVRCGTKTDTRIRAEHGDNDAAAAAAAFPRTATSGGTMTKTSVANEAGGRDQDSPEAQMRVFAGTRTRTKIKGEHAGDLANSESSILAVPRPPTPMAAQTKTVTFVKAEADDNDLSRVFLQAIPLCS